MVSPAKKVVHRLLPSSDALQAADSIECDVRHRQGMMAATDMPHHKAAHERIHACCQMLPTWQKMHAQRRHVIHQPRRWAKAAARAGRKPLPLATMPTVAASTNTRT